MLPNLNRGELLILVRNAVTGSFFAAVSQLFPDLLQTDARDDTELESLFEKQYV